MINPLRYRIAAFVAFIVSSINYSAFAKANDDTDNPKKIVANVKPLPIKKATLLGFTKSLSDSADKLVNSPAPKVVSRTLLAKYIAPTKVQWTDEIDGGVDCIKYDMKTSHSETYIGQEFEIYLHLTFVDQLPLNWREDGCNKFALKVVFPDGFAQTGGDYVDFMTVELNEQNKYQTVKIRGLMLKKVDIGQFMILKGPVGSDVNTIFIKKKTFDVKFKYTESVERISKAQSKTLQQDIITNSVSLEKSTAETNCGTPTPYGMSVSPEYFLAGQSVTLYGGFCNGITNWSDNLGNTYPPGSAISTIPSQTTIYTTTCTDNGCTSNPSAPITATLTTDCNLATIFGPTRNGGNIYPYFVTNPNESITLNASDLNCFGTTLVWSDQPTATFISQRVVQPSITTSYKVHCKHNDCLSKDFYEYKVFVKCNNISQPTIQIENHGGNILPIYNLVANNCNGTISWFKEEGGNYRLFNSSSINGNKIMEINSYFIGSYKAICTSGNCSSDFSPAFVLNSSNLPAPPPTGSQCASFSAITTPGGSSLKCGQGIELTINGCKPGSLREIITKTYNLNSTNISYTSTYSDNITVPSFSNLSIYAYPVEVLVGCENTCNSISSYARSWYYVNSNGYANNKLKPTINAPSTQCVGGSTNLKINQNCDGVVEWTNGMFGKSIIVSPSVTTSYQARCISLNCDNPWSDPVTITVDPNLNAPSPPTIWSDATYYTPGTYFPVSLGAPGCSGSILWSTGQTDGIIYVRPEVETTYTARCVSGGCQSLPSNPITIQVCGTAPAPSITASATTYNRCTDPSITLTATGCGTNPIKWTYKNLAGETTGLFTAYQNQTNVTPEESGVYTARCVSASGCESMASSPINITTTVSNFHVVNFPPGTVCNGASATMTVAGCDGVINWYNYYTNQYLATGSSFTDTFIIPSNIQEQGITYKVICTINNNCIIERYFGTNVKNPQPPTLITNATQICVGNSVTLSAACNNSQTLFSNGTGNYFAGNYIGNSTYSITVNPTSTTTYTAVCSDFYATNCNSTPSNPITVIAKDIPPALTITAGSTTVCPGGSTTITANTCAGGVNWSNGANGQSITVTPSAQTSYTATCTNECGASPVSNTVTIDIVPLNPPTISATKTTICNTPGEQFESTTLTAVGCTGSVEWSTGAVTNPITITPNTSSTYTAKCILGACESLDSDPLQITVLSIPLAPNVTSSSQFICQENLISTLLTASGCNGTYKWYKNNVLIAGATASTLTESPTATTVYGATCTNICGESVKGNVTVTIVPKPNPPTIASNKQSVCQNIPTDVATLNTSGCSGTIEWGGGELAGMGIVGASVQVRPTQLTAYTAKCVVNGCASNLNSINIGIAVERLLTFTSTKQNVCINANESVSVTVSNCYGSPVTWLENGATIAGLTDSTITRVVNVATVYTATCQGRCEVITGTKSIGTNPQPVIPTFTGTTTICSGGNTTIVVNNCVGDVIWDAGVYTGNIRPVNPAVTTTYTAICRNEFGCNSGVGSVTVTVNQPITNLTATSDSPKKIGETLTFTSTVTPLGTYTYAWTGPVSFVSAVANPSRSGLLATHAGIYTLTVNNGACPPMSTVVEVVINDVDCKCTACDQQQTVFPIVSPNAAITGQNYVVENTYLEALTAIPTATNTAKILQTINYFDGLGRPIQTTGVKTGPNQEDLIASMQYDPLGRESTKYLPFAKAANNGGLISNVTTSVANYYATDIGKSSQKDFAFATTVFEPSPLNRVIEQGATGSDWQPGSNHTIRTTYAINTRTTLSGTPTIEERLKNDIRRFTFTTLAATIEAQTVTVGLYDANQLSVTIITDENGNKSAEIKDKDGKLVCKRSENFQNGVTEIIETLYAYDDFGFLRFVFQPMASVSTALPSNNTSITPLTVAAIKDFIFAYNYDGRGRIIEKQVPGAAKEMMVYDGKDRLAWQTAGWGSASRKGLYSIYDDLNRVSEIGYYTTQSTAVACGGISGAINATNVRNYLQCKIDANINFFVSPETGTGAAKAALINNYYDTYPAAATGTIAFDLTHAYSQAQMTNTKGKLVLVKEKVIGQNETVNAAVIFNTTISTTTYYDNLGRTIQTATLNHTGGTDRISMQLDFAGRVLATKTNTTYKRTATDAAPDTRTIETKTTYDYGSRVASICQKNDTDGWEPVVRNTYSGIGELNAKKLGCDQQIVDYRYNIRSWLTQINNPDNLTAGKDLFGMRLVYNTPQFNGNITSQEWKSLTKVDGTVSETTTKEKYDYTYDKLNRLLTATFTGATAGIAVNMTGTIAGVGFKGYDLNGNIGYLKRTVSGATVDELQYTYTTNNNRLDNVKDLATANTNAAYFRDLSTGTADYTYDAAGNITVDKNKDIQQIIYNHLNLPAQIKRDKTNNNTVDDANDGRIWHYYTASGRKVKMEVRNFSATINITNLFKAYDYISGGLVYAETKTTTTATTSTKALELLPSAEGRAVPIGSIYKNVTTAAPPAAPTTVKFRYEYHLKDHLGNLRVACRCADPKRNATTGDIITGAGAGTEPTMIVQENQYDPWGLNFGIAATENQKPSNLNHRWQYNGKEKIVDLSIGWNDYGARMYMSEIGRWNGIDAKSEDYTFQSSYLFVANNPVSFIDIFGKDEIHFSLASNDKGELKLIETYRKKSADLGWWHRSKDMDWTEVKYKNQTYTIGNFGWVEGIGSVPKEELFENPNFLAYLIDEGYIKSNETIRDEYNIEMARLVLNSHSRFNRGSLSVGIRRPTWQQTERDVEAMYIGSIPQASYKNGRIVPYNTKGSVRPDVTVLSGREIVEAKNYYIGPGNNGGKDRLLGKVVEQVRERQSNLPKGTLQTIVIDVRGQSIKPIDLLKLSHQILTQTGSKNVRINFLR